MGAAVALPESSDRAKWSEDDAARVEAAGLVYTFPYGERKGERVLAPRAVVEKFFHTVQRTGLDPLARQIYCIPRFGRDGLEWSIQTAIDGFRVVAQRSGQYAGQEPAQWLTEAGDWVDVFVQQLHGQHPLAARVTVRRHDWEIPLTAVATWDEYAQTTSKGELTSMWKQRGPGQLAKCAEALALRKAFPQDLSGIYTDEEMDAAAAREETVSERRPKQVQTIADRMRAAEAPADEEPVEGVIVPEGTDAPEEDAAAPVSPTAPEADGSWPVAEVKP